MNSIVEVAAIKGRFFVFCAPDEKTPVSVKSIIISDAGGDAVRLTKFCLERTRQCFGDAPASPWFRIDEEINERFLQAGNSVAFETEAEYSPNWPLNGGGESGVFNIMGNYGKADAESRRDEKTLSEVAEPATAYAG